MFSFTSEGDAQAIETLRQAAQRSLDVQRQNERQNVQSGLVTYILSNWTAEGVTGQRLEGTVLAGKVDLLNDSAFKQAAWRAAAERLEGEQRTAFEKKFAAQLGG